MKVPLTYQQQGVWLLEQIAPGTGIFNVGFAYRLQGDLDRGALDGALTKILARHESLRTTIALVNGVPQAHVGEPADVRAVFTDARGPVPSLDRLLAEATRRPFDLTSDPLLRADLFQLSPDLHILLICCQHIACDARSLGVLRAELAHHYNSIVTGASPSPGLGVPYQYPEYAEYQLQQLADGELDASVEYWKGHLRDIPDQLPLPTDFPRPQAGAFPGSSVRQTIDPSLWEGIHGLCGREQASPFMVFLTALAVVLGRYGRTDDVLVGSAIANRQADEEDAVGLFANLVTLRMRIPEGVTFRDLLRSAKDEMFNAHEHREVPFETVLSAIGSQVGGGRHLFQVVLQTLDLANDGLNLHGLRVESVPASADTAIQFDIGINLGYDEERARLDLAYRTDLFERATVEYLGRRLLQVVEASLADADRPVRELPLLLPEERALLLEWNATEHELPDADSVADLVLAAAARAPDSPALMQGTHTVTYRQLVDRARELAGRIVGRGAKPDSVVGILLERGPGLAVAQLAVWLAGCGYLVLNLRDPAERMGFQIRDGEVELVITSAELQSLIFGTAPGVLVFDDPVEGSIAGEAVIRDVTLPRPRRTGLAYIVYTSGSTGQPKGVAITHVGVLNLVVWHHDRFGMTSADRSTLTAVPSFDAWTLELWPALAAGASLLLPESYVPSGEELRDWLVDNRITLTHLTTPLADTIFDVPWPEHARLRTLLTGSERLKCRDWSVIPFEVNNGYGPTESTVISTSERVPRTLRPDINPSVGTPLHNTTVHILDERGRPAPIGMPGEVYVGGIGLAREYLARPELTRERFVCLPTIGGGVERLYRTGDYAYWRHNGSIEFIGRIDDQVKIRGFRVELGEIETLLARHPAVKRVAVIMREDRPGDKRLVAYVIPAPGHGADSSSLREHVARSLPEYMTPTAFVLLDRLPLMPNGKLNRRELPPPTASAPAENRVRRAPHSPQEEILCGLFADVLGLAHVGVEDNFFDLGGHSLLTAALIDRVRSAFGVQMSIGSLFETPTPKGLAVRLGTDADAGLDPFEVLLPLRKTGDGPPLFCVHPGAGISWTYAGLLPHISPDHPVYALQASGLSRPESQPATIEEMAASYLTKIRAVQPAGPYHLLGWSFGGTVAQTMAGRLQAEGEQVGLLALLDAYPAISVPETALTEEKALAAMLESLGHGAEIGESPLAALEADQLSALARVYSTNYELMRGFVPRKSRGDILFFRAALGEKDPVSAVDDWAQHVSGEIEVIETACHHGEMMRPDTLDQIGPLLQARMKRHS